MNDLRQDSQSGLPRNTLPCAPSILKHRVPAEVCLLGHQWISRGFTLRRFQYHQYTRTLDNDYPRNEGRLANRFFRKKTSLDVSLGPCRVTSVSKIPPPPKKKVDFFSDWVGLFEICFRSSEVTDPRPCPREWAYFRVPSRSTKTCQTQTNNSCKNRYLYGSEKHHRTKHPLPKGL